MEVQLIKHFSKGKWALSTCLSLTALFLKNPINNPEKFISPTVSVAGISLCYLERIISPWEYSKPLLRGSKPSLTNKNLLLFS